MIKLSISAAALLLAATVPTPAFANGDAAAGLEALKNYNLIVLGDVNLRHDVEGKMLVGGNLTGTSQVGIGNGSQGQASAGGIPILTVGGNLNNSDIKVHNGSNGGSGFLATGGGASVAGNVNNSWLTINSTPRTVNVGGNFSGSNPNINSGDIFNIGGSFSNANVNNNGGTLNVGGTASGNFNGGSTTQNLGAGFASSISTPIIDTVNTVTSDVIALSSTLAAMNLLDNPSSFNITGTAMTLNAVDNGAGFALFSFNAADFAGITELTYAFPSNTLPVIVNVLGADVTFGFNSNSNTNRPANQQIIWNFVDAETLNFTGNMFHGSVLAPNASLLIHTPIEGSVAVGQFTQGRGAEIHLGTFNGQINLVTPAIPEPATWAMMIAGFGLIGASMRRRAVSLRFA